MLRRFGHDCPEPWILPVLKGTITGNGNYGIFLVLGLSSWINLDNNLPRHLLSREKRERGSKQGAGR